MSTSVRGVWPGRLDGRRLFCRLLGGTVVSASARVARLRARRRRRPASSVGRRVVRGRGSCPGPRPRRWPRAPRSAGLGSASAASSGSREECRLAQVRRRSAGARRGGASASGSGSGSGSGRPARARLRPLARSRVGSCLGLAARARRCCRSGRRRSCRLGRGASTSNSDPRLDRCRRPSRASTVVPLGRRRRRPRSARALGGRLGLVGSTGRLAGRPGLWVVRRLGRPGLPLVGSVLGLRCGRRGGGPVRAPRGRRASRGSKVRRSVRRAC